MHVNLAIPFLPKTSSAFSQNYHLIDYQEVLVIALFLMRRIGWIVFEQVCMLCFSPEMIESGRGPT